MIKMCLSLYDILLVHGIVGGGACDGNVWLYESCFYFMITR